MVVTVTPFVTERVLSTGAVTAVLASRGVSLDPAERDRILSERDLAQLERWLVQSTSCSTVAELLRDPERDRAKFERRRRRYAAADRCSGIDVARVSGGSIGWTLAAQRVQQSRPSMPGSWAMRFSM